MSSPVRAADGVTAVAHAHGYDRCAATCWQPPAGPRLREASRAAFFRPAASTSSSSSRTDGGQCDRGSSNSCIARGAADYCKRLTASLCMLTWLDFRSHPQELQARSTKAIFEHVILAGSSFSPLWRACTRGRLGSAACEHLACVSVWSSARARASRRRLCSGVQRLSQCMQV